MTVATGIAHVTFMTLLVVEVQKWFTVATAGLTTPAQIRPFRTLHDTLLVVGFAAYGAAAVALAAVVRRVFHHGIALLAFAASMSLLVYGYAMGRLPPLETTPGLNGVGATFGALVAGLALAAVLSRYAMRDLAGRRPLAIAYELLAVAVSLGLYLVEISRWNDRQAALGDHVPAATLLALCASGLAVFGLGLVARAAWITSLAHRIASGLCTMAAITLLAHACLSEAHTYDQMIWNPRGLALIVLALALAGSAVVARYARGAETWRAWFVAYELAAWTVVLGLYLTELFQFAAHHANLRADLDPGPCGRRVRRVRRGAGRSGRLDPQPRPPCIEPALRRGRDHPARPRLRTRGPRLRRHGLESAMLGPGRPGPGHGRLGRRGPLRPRG